MLYDKYVAHNLPFLQHLCLRIYRKRSFFEKIVSVTLPSCSAGGVFIRWNFPVKWWLNHEIYLFFCLLSTRSCHFSDYFSDGYRAQSPLEKIEIFFFPCQIGQVFPAQYPQAYTQTVDRQTAWFSWVTPRKMREHTWQFQGYWAAWRLKAENYVVFHSTAFLRSKR